VKNEECYEESSCLLRASIVSKTLFIIPTDAYIYKIIGMLKTVIIQTINGILIVFNITMIL
jgi:hypothetical protein